MIAEKFGHQDTLDLYRHAHELAYANNEVGRSWLLLRGPLLVLPVALHCPCVALTFARCLALP
jgi:hypothetical protein